MNFIPTSSVTYNGVVHPVLRTPTYVSSTVLTITLSAADQATVGSYPVQVTNPAPGGGASNIVDFQVTSPAVGAACITGNAITTLISGSNVTAYVPNGAWGNSITGIEVVPIEPSPVSTPSAITTPNTPNACAGNSATQEVICTANNTDVYVINGSSASVAKVLTSGSDVKLHDESSEHVEDELWKPAALSTTLTSGSTGTTEFTGGSCNNCGVAINAITNTAVIWMGLSSSPSTSGLQFLDLSNNTLGAPIPVGSKSQRSGYDRERDHTVAE
jgi:hypothetical protein